METFLICVGWWSAAVFAILWIEYRGKYREALESLTALLSELDKERKLKDDAEKAYAELSKRIQEKALTKPDHRVETPKRRSYADIRRLVQESQVKELALQEARERDTAFVES